MQVARGRKGRTKRKPKGQDNTEGEPQERSEERKNAIVKMVAEGAYRKATMAMIKQGEVITGSECGHWADVLHPRSRNQEGVLTQPKDEQPNHDTPVQGSPPPSPSGTPGNPDSEQGAGDRAVNPLKVPWTLRAPTRAPRRTTLSQEARL